MSEEIREQVNILYTKLEKCFDPSTFVLNTSFNNYREQLEDIRKTCNHKFENGECIYCDIKEEETIK